jgi:hypothetical protein
VAECERLRVDDNIGIGIRECRKSGILPKGAPEHVVSTFYAIGEALTRLIKDRGVNLNRVERRSSIDQAN